MTIKHAILKYLYVTLSKQSHHGASSDHLCQITTTVIMLQKSAKRFILICHEVQCINRSLQSKIKSYRPIRIICLALSIKMCGTIKHYGVQLYLCTSESRHCRADSFTYFVDIALSRIFRNRIVFNSISSRSAHQY